MDYIKQLTPQELGYRNGSLKTGGYFYISKKAAKTFFGLLSKTKLNDSRIIRFYQLSAESEYAEASFVFHNDRFAKNGTRDEYRIYLNRNIQLHDLHFRPGDIVILRDKPSKYSLLHFRPGDEEFEFWKGLLDQHGRNGNHAIIDSHS